MKGKTPFSTIDLFRKQSQANSRPKTSHFILAWEIDWSVFETAFGPTYSEGTGRSRQEKSITFPDRREATPHSRV